MPNDSLTGLRGTWLAFSSPFRGVGAIARRPSLWPLAIVPTVLLLVSVVAGAAAARAAYGALEPRLAAWLHSTWLGAAGDAVAAVLVVALLVIAVLLLAMIVVPLLSAPFMDALASRVDERPAREESLAAQIARSIRVALTGLVLVALPQLVVWALSLVVPVLAPLWLALGIAVAALGLAYDALDWPLARRGYGVRARIAWMRQHAALTFGLGLAVWLMFWLPGMSIVMLPATVVGGVSLVNAVERARGAATAGS